MAKVAVSIKVTTAWWWPLYVAGLVTAARMTGAIPDLDKVQRVALKAIRIKVE